MQSDPKDNYLDALDEFVWGAKAIGELINRTERQTFHLLEQGALPATKCGRQWCTTKRRILEMVTPRVEAAD